MSLYTPIDTKNAARASSPVPDAIDRERPFKLLSAIHELKPSFSAEGRQQSLWRSAVANRLYLTREAGRDVFGPVPDWSMKRGDLGGTRTPWANRLRPSVGRRTQVVAGCR